MEMLVCVCTCGGYVVYIVVVSLAQGLRSLVQAPLWQFFHLVFHQPPPAPPVHPAIIGYLAFAGMQIKDVFSQKSNGPGGTSGAHSTCCEEDRPILLRVPRPPQYLSMPCPPWHSVNLSFLILCFLHKYE